MNDWNSDELVNHWLKWQGAIDCSQTNKIWKAGEMIALSKKISQQLKETGIKEGDIVALIMGNTVAFPVILHSVLMIKANPLLLHVSTTDYELNQEFGEIAISWLICDKIESLSRIKEDKYPVMMSTEINSITLKVLCLNRERKKSSHFKGVIFHPTSGTSGSSKICIRDQNVAVAEGINYTSTIKQYNRIRIYITTPLSHAYAFGFGLVSSILTHSTLVVSPFFNPKELLRREQKMPSNILTAVPPMFQTLIHFKNLNPDYYIPEMVFYAGTRCDPSSMQELEKTFNCTVYSIYGTTETGAIASSCIKGHKTNGVGKSLNNVNISIRKKENYTNIGSGVGEIFIHSSSMMQGYYNDDLSKKIDYFATGDLGYFDNNQCLELIGRQKDIINVSGMKINPSEVEEVIFTFPGVQDCAVYPGENKEGDEIIVAAVYMEKKIFSSDRIKKHISNALNHYKIPHAIFCVDKIPRTASGKCLKNRLPGYKKY